MADSDAAGVIEEVLGTFNGFIFKDDSLGPVFCKPKLIPLKSVTLEKLQEMQKKAVEVNRSPSTEPQPSTSEANNEKMNADIWEAEDPA